MSAELWDLIIKSNVKFLLKLDVLSQSVMIEEFISETTIIILTVLTDIT